LQRLKDKLSRLNNEGSSIEEMEKKFMLLTQEFKNKSEELNKLRRENERLEKIMKEQSEHIDGKKRAIVDEIANAELHVNTLQEENDQKEAEIHAHNDKMDGLQDTIRKGKSAEIELEKLRKWKERKTAKIREEQKAFEDDLRRKVNLEAEHAKQEQKYRTLHQDLKDQSSLLVKVKLTKWMTWMPLFSMMSLLRRDMLGCLNRC